MKFLKYFLIAIIIFSSTIDASAQINTKSYKGVMQYITGSTEVSLLDFINKFSGGSSSEVLTRNNTGGWEWLPAQGGAAADVTRAYVDGTDSVLLAGLTGKLNLSGGTMTSDILMANDATGLKTDLYANSIQMATAANGMFLRIYGQTYADAASRGMIILRRYTGSGADAASGRFNIQQNNGSAIITDAFFNKSGNLNLGTGDIDSASSSYKLYITGSSFVDGTSYFGSTGKRITNTGNAFLGQGEFNYAGGNTLSLNDTTAVGQNNGGMLNLQGYYTGGALATFAKIQGGKENDTDSNQAGFLKLSTNSGGAGIKVAVWVNSSRNVTIGENDSASTTKRLYVDGAAQITNGLNLGNISSGTGSSLGIDGSGNVITVAGGSSATNTTVTATAQENISAGDIVRIINNGGLKAYKYLTDLDIIQNTTSYGVFGTGYAHNYPCVAIQLSENIFVIAYNNGTTIDAIGIQYNPVSKAITKGTIKSSVFNTVESLTGTRLSNNTFALAGKNGSGALSGVVCYYDELLGTITAGSPSNNLVASLGGSNVGMTALTANLVAFVYNAPTTGYVTTVVCNIYPGTMTITANATTSTLSTYASGLYFDIKRLSDTTYAVVASVASYRCSAWYVSYSNQTSTYNRGTYADVSGAATYYKKIVPISAEKFVIVFQNASGYLSAVTMKVNLASYDITSGSINNNINETVSIGSSLWAEADGTEGFVVAYQGTSQYLDVSRCKLSGTTITAIKHKRNLSGGYVAGNISMCLINPKVYAIAHKGNSGYMDLAHIDISAQGYPAMADATVTSGNSGTMTLMLDGIKYTNAAYSFQTYDKLYLNSSSQISTVYNKNYYIGTALSSTSILIDGSSDNTTAGNYGSIPSLVQHRK